MEDKDYSLLRPFDEKSVKPGDLLLDVAGDECQYVAGPHPVTKEIVIAFPDKTGFIIGFAEGLRMPPLCWVEGKPVYKGDVLYQNTASLTGAHVVIGGDEDGIIDDQGRGNSRSKLTWIPPKVKLEGWVNIYKDSNATIIHATKLEADKAATDRYGNIDSTRVACIRIEWEEPASQ